ncbi:MAG: hypothetical protein WAK48_28205, partial [Candidatus Acidiferrum sp.]
RSLLPSDHTSKAHGGKELLLRTPRPIRRQLKSVTNLVLGVISVGLKKFLRSRIGEALQQKRFDAVLPSGVDNSFMREDSVTGATRSKTCPKK